MTERASTETLVARLGALGKELSQLVSEVGAEVAAQTGGDREAVAEMLHVGSDLIAGVFGYAARLRNGDFKPEPNWRSGIRSGLLGDADVSGRDLSARDLETETADYKLGRFY